MGEVIRARLVACPFVPFRMALVGGYSCEVFAPDLATVEDEVVRVYVRPPGRPNGRTLKAVVSLLHVVAVEDASDGPIVVTSGN